MPRPRNERPNRHGILALDLGALLRQTREGQHRTLTEIAAAGGITKHTLADIERGEDNPTLERVERIARMYGLTLTFAPTNPAHIKRQRRQPRQETLT